MCPHALHYIYGVWVLYPIYGCPPNQAGSPMGCIFLYFHRQVCLANSFILEAFEYSYYCESVAQEISIATHASPVSHMNP
jgi:hypothetical protein